MAEQIDVQSILEASGQMILDVRTPSEFAHGHIPGARNLPLFSDDERAEVGTLYKQKGPEHAMARGLEIAGPKMQSLVSKAKKLLGGRRGVIHCWRGGKRSASVAWLLNFCGLSVSVLAGGYKTYRRYIHTAFEEQPWILTVLGGRTGSGKTEILHTLRDLGEQVLDLEKIANHKGSAFGWIGEEEQPACEQFENLLFQALSKLDPKRRIWVENESKSIGRVYIPDTFWAKMKAAPLVHLEVKEEDRVKRLVKMYTDSGTLPDLEQSFHKIERRLGGQNLKLAIEALQNRDYHSAARIALRYYDKTYDYNLRTNRSPEIHVLKISVDDDGLESTARRILDFADAQINTLETARGY